MTNNTATGHALCAPSGADRWMTCPGSVAMELIEPPSTSAYAEEGTRAHWLATVYFGVADGAAATPTVTDLYPQDMHDYVKGYVDDVLERVEDYKRAGAVSVKLMVEQELPLEPITGEKDAHGTSDVVILAQFSDRCVLEVADLKYGMGVKVSAEDNPQLKIYALAALEEHVFKKPVPRVESVVMRIHQPRVSETASEWCCSQADLTQWLEAEVKPKANVALHLAKQARPSEVHKNLNPSEDACRFCRAAATCPALSKSVHETVFDKFQDISDEGAQPITPETTVLSDEEYGELLPTFMKRVGLIENWCTAVRSKVESKLMSGEPVEGFKLVEGRRGHRKWKDEAKTRSYLALIGVQPTRYLTEPALRTPAVLEKEFGKKKGPEEDKAVWAKMNGTDEEPSMIEQPDGKPSVAPMDDDRPPWLPKANIAAFDDHSVDDLF